MQINIAVCDDESEICSYSESMLISILKELSIDYVIDLFYSGESLCKELSKCKNEYDLLFLDIEFPTMNGVEIGKYIRETLKNETLHIAYISSKQDYAMDLFDYRPINFLVKPLNRKNFKKVIDKYLIISGQEHHIFTYKKGFKSFRIPMSDIMYFQSENRKVDIITRDSTDTFYDTMEHVYSNVKGQKFLFIHKSTIINYNYISYFDYEHVTMMDGMTFTISQPRRKDIRAKYMEIRESEE